MPTELFSHEDDNDIDIPKEKRKLNTVSYDYSVEFIFSLIGPKIILEVPFQRKFVWKNDRASQLVESIIMNVPIPPLYFAEEDNGKWLVVDGLQRLNAIKSFFDNEFSLQRLEIIKELEGCKFKDLPPKSMDLLKDELLRINVIKKDSHPDIKYDIFMRLNRGAVSLNTQELRNCLYRGSLNDMLKELVNHSTVLQLVNLAKSHNKYLDVEFIIRYLAFSTLIDVGDDGKFYIRNYRGSLKTFLNEFMGSQKDASASELEVFKQKVLSTFEKALAVFGDSGGLRNPSRKTHQINKAFADCVLLCFERYDRDTLVENRDKLFDLRNKVFADERFLSLISNRTTDSTVIKGRINLWMEEVENAIAS